MHLSTGALPPGRGCGVGVRACGGFSCGWIMILPGWQALQSVLSICELTGLHSGPVAFVSQGKTLQQGECGNVPEITQQ